MFRDDLKVAVRMIVLITCLQGLPGFIYLGNTQMPSSSLQSLVCISVASFQLSIVLCGRKKPNRGVYGAFKLGQIEGMGISLHCDSIAGTICHDFQRLPQLSATQCTELEIDLPVSNVL